MEWPQLLRIAMGHLRIPPDLFWSLTPQINRAALAELEARFATTDKECSDEPCETTARF